MGTKATLKIVIDQGATKTLTKAYVNRKDVYYSRVPTNPTAKALEHVTVPLFEALDVLGLTETTPTQIIVSCASVNPGNHREFQEYFKNFSHDHVELVDFICENDGVVPLALHPAANLSILMGTGSNLVIRTLAGDFKELGRDKIFGLRNSGSGFKIGYRAAQKVAQTPANELGVEGRIVAKIVAHGLNDRKFETYELDETTNNKEAPELKQAIAALTKNIMIAANKGNSFAREIIETEVRNHAHKLHERISKEFPKNTVFVAILTGSIANSEISNGVLEYTLRELGENLGYSYEFLYNSKELPYSGFSAY